MPKRELPLFSTPITTIKVVNQIDDEQSIIYINRWIAEDDMCISDWDLTPKIVISIKTMQDILDILRSLKWKSN